MSAISSPRKMPGEIGGTGNNERERTREKPNLKKKQSEPIDVNVCEKEGCRLPAYGRCHWRNPCRIPEKTGGCNQLYCELHGAHFDNFRKFQCCTNCHTNFLWARKRRHDCRLILYVILVLLVIVTGTMTAMFLAIEPEVQKHFKADRSDQ